ncbi:hypothetical protein [Nonomuraea sp. NPDC049784]
MNKVAPRPHEQVTASGLRVHLPAHSFVTGGLVTTPPDYPGRLQRGG